MQDKDTDIDVEERVEHGWIHLNMMIEVQGNNKDHINKALETLVKKLSLEKEFILLSDSIDKPSELGEKWFSNVVELELLAKGFDGLSKIAIQYSPSSLEILAPKEVKIRSNLLQQGLLDIASMITTFAHAAYLARQELKKAK